MTNRLQEGNKISEKRLQKQNVKNLLRAIQKFISQITYIKKKTIENSQNETMEKYLQADKLQFHRVLYSFFT